MPDTINGFPIIATWNVPKRKFEEAGRIIVVDRGAKYGERYVVAWQSGATAAWCESAYCVELAEASRVFATRISREVQR